MTELKLINEIGMNDTLLALETAPECVCHCTWCYVALNRKAKGTTIEPRDTLNRYINKAFGPDYDPENYIQWSLRNKLPITWATTVEPWQDVALACQVLDVFDRLEYPLFFQTRGTNWRKMWPRIQARADQTCLFVSCPTDDDAVYKRYEPGTPRYAEREALIRAACESGIPVTLAMAPYHPEWLADPESFLRRMIGLGIKEVFWDPLHLSGEQDEVATDRAIGPLAKSVWRDERTFGHGNLLRTICIEEDLDWIVQAVEATQHGLETVNPFAEIHYRDAFKWDYHHYDLFQSLHAFGVTADRPFSITWGDTLKIMEAVGSVDQQFKFSVFRSSFHLLRYLSSAVLESLRPTCAFRDVLRALWNRAGTSGFVWKHPFLRRADQPDGRPWLDSDGNLILIHDPDHGRPSSRQTVDDLDSFPRFSSRERT